MTTAETRSNAHWLTRYDPDDGEPYGEICHCGIGDDHDAAGGVMQAAPADGDQAQPETAAADITLSKHGHTINVNGADIRFDTLFDAYGEELGEVLVWTHDMPDAEVILRARAYLEGPFKAAYYDPYDEGGVDPDHTWPEPGDDLTKHVRRVWARWHVITEEEAAEGEFYESHAGDVRWKESPGPREGFAPASVVKLG